MRWREKFCLVKICWNEVGDNIPYTLCIPRLPPFYNFFGGGKEEDDDDDAAAGVAFQN